LIKLHLGDVLEVLLVVRSNFFFAKLVDKDQGKIRKILLPENINGRDILI
jgi:hypothetical protein